MPRAFLPRTPPPPLRRRPRSPLTLVYIRVYVRCLPLCCSAALLWLSSTSFVIRLIGSDNNIKPSPPQQTRNCLPRLFLLVDLDLSMCSTRLSRVRGGHALLAVQVPASRAPQRRRATLRRAGGPLWPPRWSPVAVRSSWRLGGWLAQRVAGGQLLRAKLATTVASSQQPTRLLLLSAALISLTGLTQGFTVELGKQTELSSLGATQGATAGSAAFPAVRGAGSGLDEVFLERAN